MKRGDLTKRPQVQTRLDRVRPRSRAAPTFRKATWRDVRDATSRARYPAPIAKTPRENDDELSLQFQATRIGICAKRACNKVNWVTQMICNRRMH